MMKTILLFAILCCGKAFAQNSPVQLSLTDSFPPIDSILSHDNYFAIRSDSNNVPVDYIIYNKQRNGMSVFNTGTGPAGHDFNPPYYPNDSAANAANYVGSYRALDSLIHWR